MKRRTKRISLWVVRLLIVGVCVLFFANPSSRMVIFGFLRGERFYAGKPTSFWRQALQGEKAQPNPPSQSPFAAALSKYLPFLTSDDHYRGSFWELSKGGREAIPVLIQLLNDNDSEIRVMALQVIDSIRTQYGSAALKEVTPALLDALKDEDENVRLSAAGILGKASPENGEAIALLIEALKDRQNPRRLGVIWMLGEIGPKAKDAVPWLIEILKEDDNWGTRMSVISTLGQIGSDAKKAIPELRELLKRTKDASIHWQAQDALDKINVAEAGK